MMRRLAVFILALVASPALAQEEAKPAWYGVWEGTVGTYPVVACLLTDRPWTIGAYYYRSSLRPIGLMGGRDDGSWAERDGPEENGAEWTAVAVRGDRLTGRWLQKDRSLPIALERREWSAPDEFDGPCESGTFLGPLGARGSIEESVAELDGTAYSKLGFVSPQQEDMIIESFALVPEQPGDDKINAVLHGLLPDGSPTSEMMQCMGMAIAAHGSDGYFSHSVEPTIIGRNLLVARESHDLYCGGAHPSTWWVWRVFDRRTGDESLLSAWLNSAGAHPLETDPSSEPYFVAQLTDRLRKHALVRYTDDRQECRESAEQQNYWILGLTAEGMSFTPDFPRVVMACSEEILLGWSELEPFLSDEGKAGLAALRADEAP